jgi:CHAT domain-containing protein/Tfp pilus assembly protein PilF
MREHKKFLFAVIGLVVINGISALAQQVRPEGRAEPTPESRAKSPSPSDKTGQLSSLFEKYYQLYGAGKYSEAIPVAQEALDLSEKTLGPDHPDVARALTCLAAGVDQMGNYAKAEPMYQRALKISEKTLESDPRLTATILDNLATLYYWMGNYAKAELTYQQALKIGERLGPDDLLTASILTGFANLYVAMGNGARAEPMYQQALKIKQKTAGPNHPNTAMSMAALALLYGKMGNYAKAEPLFLQALKITEKALGPFHPVTATTLNNLGMLYHRTGKDAKAEEFFQRALKIREKVFGADHQDTTTVLNNLAELYWKMGNYAKAEPLYERALKNREKWLGPDHPDTALALNNLALFKIDLGKMQEAISLTTRLRAADEKHLADILSFTSEAERLQFLKTTYPYSLPATLADAEALAQDVLRQKGIVLDSLLEDRLVARASADPKQRENIEQLQATKQRLMQLILEGPRGASGAAQKQHIAEKEKLAAQSELLEASLARQVAGLGKTRRALTVTSAQIQAALPKHSALAEFLRYYYYLGRNKWELRYGAVIIAPSAGAKWAPLGTAAEIEKSVQLYRKSARGETDEATLSAVLKILGEQIWVPIENALPAETTTVIVSPDAELSFVSFATLLSPDDRFVAEKYSIRYVASGRDLLRETRLASDPKTSIRVFANPDFALNNSVRASGNPSESALRSIEMRDLQSISLSNLPGTERECAQLEDRAKKAGWQAQVSLGPNATETELRKVNSPRILHLATHGFFLPEIDLGPPPNGVSQTTVDNPKGRLVNPMHRSGLALAGAHTTLQAWAKGDVPPTEIDGIVTAEEVGGLKLDGTWLVVLSACDTGRGEAKAGEGVMGLRRGFIQAGGQNLLMTLWPINDDVTVQIMLDFYDAAFKTGDAPQALADTQRDWLVKLRKERGLLPAVQLAGPFIMSSQGKP